MVDAVSTNTEDNGEHIVERAATSMRLDKTFISYLICRTRLSTHLRIDRDHAALALVVQGFEKDSRFSVEDVSICIYCAHSEPSRGDASMSSPSRLVSLSLFEPFGCSPSIVIWGGGDASTGEDCL